MLRWALLINYHTLQSFFHRSATQVVQNRHRVALYRS